ncbi:helix-turn-helix domain-containing protein [Flectobacillus major]|uniref:helix-turn-helix domain-containing protein n=1 Tax=Flectobacillus major TaxID=103 RepID=UPI0004147E96|nr:helix-turn-helix domain-containing protein [Flectobacillus major]
MQNISVLQVQQIDAETLINQIGCLIDSRFKSFNPPQQPTEEETFLTIEQVAKLLQVSKVTVHAWCNKEILKPKRIGNKVRFLKSEVMGSLKEIKARKEVNNG